MTEMKYREKCLSQKISVCNICGNGSPENMVVHHINGDREDDRLENLVPLCRSCHSKVHHKTNHNRTVEEYTEQLPKESLIERDGDFDGGSDIPEFSSNSATTTVEVDEQGRCTIPVEVREALGFNGRKEYVEVEVFLDE